MVLAPPQRMTVRTVCSMQTRTTVLRATSGAGLMTDDTVLSQCSDSCRCVADGAGGWTIEELLCPPGTAFHPELQICDWPGQAQAHDLCCNVCPPFSQWNVFSCEEAALEGQMLSVSVCSSVCLFDCLTPKLNITKVRLFEVYTKPIDFTRVHKTSLLYKCKQN